MEESARGETAGGSLAKPCMARPCFRREERERERKRKGEAAVVAAGGTGGSSGDKQADRRVVWMAGMTCGGVRSLHAAKTKRRGAAEQNRQAG